MRVLTAARLERLLAAAHRAGQLLPVARDGLLNEGAAAREYTMRFVRVPELTAQPAWQRYEPLGNRVVRYRSSGYQADITFDADGFVTFYQDYLERVG